MKILILADTDLSRDARIRRHIFALMDNYELIVSGTKNPNIFGNIEFVDCSKDPISNEELQNRRRLLRERIARKDFEAVYWGEAYIQKLYRNIKDKQFDLILANDISMVPLGVKLATEKGINIVADMHEYAPRQFEDIEEWNCLFKEYNYYLCQKYLPQCNKIITVCEGLMREYKKIFNVDCGIITNAPKYHELKIKKTEEKIRIVYHGCANKSRNLYALLDIVSKLDERYSLDFYLIEDNSDKEYFDKLCNTIKKTSRCTLNEPMSPEEIVEHLHEYDIGLYLLEPKNFNQKYALPNKFFEFIQARLAVAIGPSCEMSKYVKKYNCGIVSSEFSSTELAKLLNGLSIEEIDRLKTNSDNMAKEVNYDKNYNLLHKYIGELI